MIMAVLSANAVKVLPNLQYTGTADQMAYTDTVGRQVAIVTRAILDLDLQAVSRHMAQMVVTSLR